VLVTNGASRRSRKRSLACSTRGRVLLQRPIDHLPRGCAWPAVPSSPNHAGKWLQVTVEQLERLSRPDQSAFVCLASNPTGASMARTRCVPGHLADERAVVVTDEIYEHLVYGSARFHSMPCWCRTSRALHHRQRVAKTMP